MTSLQESRPNAANKAPQGKAFLFASDAQGSLNIFNSHNPHAYVTQLSEMRANLCLL